MGTYIQERTEKNSKRETCGQAEFFQEKENAQQAENWMQISFSAKSENEGFARTTVAAFVSYLNPTIEELADIKTAVSEAVTNCIIHGYNLKGGTVWLEPLFTTRPDLERSGMGFSFMEAFMDTVEVESAPGKGTRVVMTREIS